jgi:glycosyltransferase involved in cell wall biosynthesis
VFNKSLHLPPGKVRTVYFAPARHFERITDKAVLRKARERYDLPAKFILTLTKPGGGERKNIGQIFKAYAGYHSQVPEPYKLVIGGKDCHLYRAEYCIPGDDYGKDILFPGWIDQEDLPALYSLADLFLYPSNLEAFPIPITEAMACGTPIITSNVNGLEEIAGEAAFLVNPKNTGEITDAIIKVLAHSDIRQDLSSRGLARSTIFSWEKCAREIVEILENLVK